MSREDSYVAWNMISVGSGASWSFPSKYILSPEWNVYPIFQFDLLKEKKRSKTVAVRTDLRNYLFFLSKLKRNVCNHDFEAVVTDSNQSLF